MTSPREPSDLRTLFDALAAGRAAVIRPSLAAAINATQKPLARSLVLHLGAITAAALREPERARGLLIEAAELEAAAGLSVGSQHTLHQLALLDRHGGNLRELVAYYRATAATTRNLGNAVGLGLCHRSLGELAGGLGKLSEARRLWQSARRSLVAGRALEAEQLAGWIAALGAWQSGEPVADADDDVSGPPN